MRKYVFENEEILNADVRKILKRTTLGKFVIKFSLNFENNSREKGFENFEKICYVFRNYEENFKKSQKNSKTEVSEEIFRTWK